MRHRFHSICPYFGIFPETFVEHQLAASRHAGVVFDPFCGRGTTIFESLVRGRKAAGCDTHPVAVCISAAKSDPPSEREVMLRLNELEELCSDFDIVEEPMELAEFFSFCFSRPTLKQVLFLRSMLKWKTARVDRFIAAMSLGALHGESHRSPGYFSNRMPGTISTKPGYSVCWWTKHGYEPPERDVFAILRRTCHYRYRTPPPTLAGEVAMTDARSSFTAFEHLEGQVTDVITSPPYLDTTNYREDQWLRLWFLGGEAIVKSARNDCRHHNAGRYWTFLKESWTGIAPLLAPEARIVVRIGGRKLTKEQIRTALLQSIASGTGLSVQLVDPGVTSDVKRSQSTSFRGARPSATVEHDFCFRVFQ